MTERKPPGMTFSSWIDQQIEEAEQRGAFDDLPGAGRPLPRRAGEDAGQAWLRDYLRREGVPADVLLPTPLRLRKDAERLAEMAPELGTEQDVRAAAADLNRRILQWRRFPDGPPIFVPLVDEDAMVARWRGGRTDTDATIADSTASAEEAGAAPAGRPTDPDRRPARGRTRRMPWRGRGPGRPAPP